MVERLLDTARGARVNGFADSMARNAVRRMMVLYKSNSLIYSEILGCTDYIR